jgi:hypothetical protein
MMTIERQNEFDPEPMPAPDQSRGEVVDHVPIYGSELVEPKSNTLIAVSPEPASVGYLIRLALEKGINPTELYAILREERAAQAERAFNTAFAAFRAACPAIPRRTENTQFKVSRDGMQKAVMFAHLDDICATVDPLLPTFGLSYHFTDPEIVEGRLCVVFALSHIAGHTRRTPSMWFPLGKPIVSRDGKQVTSEAQAAGGTHTFARRYAMVSGLGLATCDDDDDGAGGGDAAVLSDAQRQTVLDLLIQVDADEPMRIKFAKSYGVEKIADIPAADFEAACNRLNKAIAARAKK